ncbi:MAG: hypothetical protein WB626_12195 [Bacteroidota bacterium]
MRHRFQLLAVLFLGASCALAQDAAPSYGITFSGFVKTDLFYDSRQTVSVREGHFLLYPAEERKDAAGTDIHAAPNLNILSIQSRLTGRITGPEALGARTSGLLEGEFFGTSDADVSGFRLRHAYLRLDWEQSSLLVGQFWHPMFVAEMFPGVVSFNTGAPFQPFSRNPQIRFTQKLGEFRLIAAALSQRDFQSSGPLPSDLSSSYLRNAVLPDLHLQVQYASGAALVGAGAGYKRLRPRLVTTRNTEADATVGSAALLAFGRVTAGDLTLKAEGTLGGNLSDLLMLGGYAVRSVDTSTGEESYEPLRSYALWGEISGGKQPELALFGGYARTLGAAENLEGPLYGRGTTIADIFRISPRIAWEEGKTRFAAEVEHTSARYGTPDPGNRGRPANPRKVSNTRLLLSAYYFF